jgi:hypothetical protein
VPAPSPDERKFAAVPRADLRASMTATLERIAQLSERTAHDEA